MSVQWIACPDCAFKLPYAILGKQGSFRTGREFGSLCRHRAEFIDRESMDGLDCPALRAEAERVLKIRLPRGTPAAPESGAG
jgi:hypothetical protein